MLFIDTRVKPAIIYTAELEGLTKTFTCYEITPTEFFVQTTALTGTLVYVGTYEDEEVWEPGIEILGNEYLSPEQILMNMSFHFQDSPRVTIEQDYHFSQSGNFENYKTGLNINGHPVFITQNMSDGICHPFIGTEFVQHQKLQAKFDISPF